MPITRRTTKALFAVSLTVLAFAVLPKLCTARDCTCRTRQIGTFKLADSRVGWIDVNATTGRLYVVAEDSMEIQVFDPSAPEAGPLARIPTEGYVGGIAIDEKSNVLYASQGFAHHIRAIDGETHAYHDLEVPDLVNAMSAITVDPDRNRLFVARTDNLDIAVFDTRSEELLDTIGMDTYPSKSVRLAVDVPTGRLLVLDGDPGTLTTLDLDGEVLGTLRVGDSPRDIAIDHEEHRAYVTNHESMNITVIDLSENPPTVRPYRDVHELRDKPSHIAIDPYTGRGYTTNQVFAKTMSVIDLTSGRLLADIRTGSENGTIAFDPGTGRAFIGQSDGSVSVVQGCGALKPDRERPEHLPIPPASAPVAIDIGSTPPAVREEAVRCTRMFRVRTRCVEGPKVHETALVRAAIEAEGAAVVDDGAEGWWCGDGLDSIEIDFSAAGFFYSVPVMEVGTSEPSVWTFSSATRTFEPHEIPTDASVVRVETPPDSTWPDALWHLSRCKTHIPAAAECCG